ncbi:type II toxin-antitoxin system PemK/MazF family toxin [Nocardia sp. alder85J]|uniref:type II toxin-antitoxin system PemK/MazF family toxin n=1 Tax=Nocardia sp. alder85J TaxID=2862949 RepID=UPI001CD62B89|nr:type II toxin-antitoxin system PemK/MazF family toxin [Nocardia sp. alder85J]MCX4097490.1 type II toxin-antitoxin system PemK/MazF family toxin [Nocardia sp. alder85J]
MPGTWSALGKQWGTLAIYQGPHIMVRQAPRLVRRMALASLRAWTPLPEHLARITVGRTTLDPAECAPADPTGTRVTSMRDTRPTPEKPGHRRPAAQRPPAIEIRPVASPPVPSRDRARHLVYCPHLDGRADAGEIVWTWIPAADTPAEGRDQPVLLVGRSRTTLLGLLLSTDPVYELDPAWIAIGAGPWSHGSPLWVRLDVVVDTPEAGIRREGAILPRNLFDLVAHRLCAEYQWL